MQNQKSALGMDGNVTALIGYLVGIVALVLIFIEKENKFVRFHAIQSVLWVLGVVIGGIVVLIIGSILGWAAGQVMGALGLAVWGITMLLYLGLFFVMFGGLIFGAIKSYGGAMTKLPFVGNMAEKWA